MGYLFFVGGDMGVAILDVVAVLDILGCLVVLDILFVLVNLGCLVELVVINSLAYKLTKNQQLPNTSTP